MSDHGKSPSHSRASSVRSWRSHSRSQSRPRTPAQRLHRVYSSGFTDDRGVYHADHDHEHAASKPTPGPGSTSDEHPLSTSESGEKEEVESIESPEVRDGIPEEHDIEKGELKKQDSRQSSKKERDPNLVSWQGEDDPENPKNWAMKRKWAATFIVSSFTFISPVSSSMVAPALADMSRDLGVHGSVETSLLLSIFIAAYAVGPLILGPLSELYGRVPVLQLANLFYFAFNMGCGFAKTPAQMLVFRFLAGLGGSAPLACGGGVLSDCWRPEQRGKAVSIYSLAPLLGPAIGPVAGGFIAENTTWRWTFWATCIADALIQLSGLFFLQETYAPKLLNKKLLKLRKETNNPDLYTEYSRSEANQSLVHKLRVSCVRPFRLLATQPIIQVLAIYMAYLYGLLYLVLSTFPGLWSDPRPNGYGFSIGIGGLHYISLGLGFFIGAQTCAPLNDRIYRVLKKRNNGVGLPEFRVPMMVPGAILVPVGLFWYGWSAQAKVFWLVPDIGAAVFCAGTIIGFQSIQTYIVDCYARYAASGVASATVLRSLAGFGFPLFAPTMYAALGYGWGNSVLGFAGIALGIPGPFLLWRYGAALRAKSQFAAGGD